jgi:sugar lactone lactonase YvrE
MTRISAAPQPVPATGRAELGESPVWDPRLARLYWVDIPAGHLHWLDDRATERGTLTLPGPVGFVGLTDDPATVVVGCATRLLAVQLPFGCSELLAELAPADSGLRCNDGKCDPTGCLWAGTMPSNDGQPPGALFSLDPARRLRRRLDDLGCSNGLAWHAEKREFYFIDSLTRRVDRRRWDPATGDISDAQPLVTFPPSDGLPDGMCIDVEGHLWVAFWGGGCVRRIDSRTGAVLARMDFPVSRVTCCSFGGANLDTLFVTTAAEGLDASARAAQPLAGRVFTIHPGVRGRPPDYFSRSQPCRAGPLGRAGLAQSASPTHSP